MTIGFADDTNILAYGRTYEICAKAIEEAYEVAAGWADEKGMEFGPAKSELIYFGKGEPCQRTVGLRNVNLEPVESARFLGIWLDRKLSNSAHIRALRKKLQTQKFALTRLAASTWGCSVQRAREIYTKVIRAAMAYGTGVTHDPKKAKVAKAMQKEQNACLRVVLGAYKATPTRNLELETFCPPLDIYFNKRLADFEARLRESGMGEKIKQACNQVRAHLRNRRGRRRQCKEVPWHGPWAEEWENGNGAEEALRREWEGRWKKGEQGRAKPADTAQVGAFHGSHLALYGGNLSKAECAVLAQARTEKIGLKDFLYKRKVPSITSPICPCGRGRQTIAHLVLNCRDEKS
jgi:hypothetical protein